jgi:uncharacterized coiled-coil protein SlyX
MSQDPPEWLVDVEVKLAYQERAIADLDALVRALAERLAEAERRLAELTAALPPPSGPANEPPPHY